MSGALLVESELCFANDQNEFVFSFDPFASRTGYYQVENCEGTQPTLVMTAGVTYTFVQHDSTNWYHPLGFAYYPDGAHKDVPELEPVCTASGCETDCTEDCCQTETCDTPQYFINGVAITDDESGFGLDGYEPHFFWPKDQWSESQYSVQITITSDVEEFFYFCHIHNNMSGRIKVQDCDNNGCSLRSEEDSIPLGYEYPSHDAFDQMCGTTGMSEFARSGNFEIYCPDMVFICSDESNSWIDCNEATECYMNHMMRVRYETTDSVELFMKQMIPHHVQAVEMSKVLLKGDYSNSEEIDDLLWAIINDQNYQINEMQGYLEEIDVSEELCASDESNKPAFLSDIPPQSEQVFGAPCYPDSDNTFTFRIDPHVQSMGSFFVEGCEGYQPTLMIEKDVTYTFKQFDWSNWMHPLGFAYFPDGAHRDNPELEPGCSAEGCDSECQGTCCETESCDAPQYFINGVPITDDESGFGLDAYEPDFFLPAGDWVANTNHYSIELTVTSDVSEIFYFCHIHNYMSARIKIGVSDEEDIPIPYDYETQTDFEAMCGANHISPYSRLESYDEYCGSEQFFCYDEGSAFIDCMEAVDCHMNAEMRVNYIDPMTTFMHQMIPHHQNAVNMAKVLLKELLSIETVSMDLAYLLGTIINVQNYQIGIMEEWLKHNGQPADSYCPKEGQESVNSKLVEKEVVPDVLSSLPDDIYIATISFPGADDVTMENAVLTPTLTVQQPSITWTAEDGVLYTVMMTDPDALSRDNPIYREYSHMSAHNIEGGQLSPNMDADYAISYTPPGPPYNSGLHRYIVLVYAQPNELDVDSVISEQFSNGVTGGYKFENIAAAYELRLVAANLFEAQWDKKVDELHESWGWLPPEPYRSPYQLSQLEEATGDDSYTCGTTMEECEAAYMAAMTPAVTAMMATETMDSCDAADGWWVVNTLNGLAGYDADTMSVCQSGGEYMIQYNGMVYPTCVAYGDPDNACGDSDLICPENPNNVGVFGYAGNQRAALASALTRNDFMHPMCPTSTCKSMDELADSGSYWKTQLMNNQYTNVDESTADNVCVTEDNEVMFITTEGKYNTCLGWSSNAAELCDSQKFLCAGHNGQGLYTYGWPGQLARTLAKAVTNTDGNYMHPQCPLMICSA